jgi:hypothetical protein
MDIDTLQNKINEIQKQLDMLKSVANIPKDVEEAFRERLRVPTIQETTPIAEVDLERSIVLSGDPETIEVMRYPDEWITVTTNRGQVKKIPVYIE